MLPAEYPQPHVFRGIFQQRSCGRLNPSSEYRPRSLLQGWRQKQFELEVALTDIV